MRPPQSPHKLNLDPRKINTCAVQNDVIHIHVYTGPLHCVLGYEEPWEGINEDEKKCTDQSKNVF